MKIVKRLIIALLVLIVLAFAFLLAAPIIFKDQIVENVKAGVNKALAAEVDFADVNLSFLRSFPDVSLTIDELEVIGIDTFAGLPLMTAKRAQVDVGFWSVVGGDGNYNIDEIVLDEPKVNLLVLTPELANYLVVAEGDDPAPSTSPAPATAQINLSRFEINNGSLVYDDRTTQTYLKMEGLSTSGEGDFTDVVFNLDLDAKVESVTLKQSGTTYLNRVNAVAEGVINVDLNQSKYTFLDTKARLNALDLIFAGSVDLEDNDDIVFKLNYSAPANDFRQLWSLIPSAYTQGYEQVKTKGAFTLNGTVDGPYNGEKETYPAFTLQTSITDGSVQYPGRPIGLTDINANVSINSPSSDLNQLTVAIPAFNFDLGGDPFRGSFKLATPMSDPQVDATVKGTLDLDKWAQAIPLEGIRELGGKIVADITMERVRQSLLDAGRYQDLKLLGNLKMTNFVYAAEALPVVKIASAQADFTPQAINVPSFAATLGRSDVSGSGKIDNPLAYFSPGQTMEGDFILRSAFFDADEWMEEKTATATLSPAELNNAAVTTSTDIKVFDRFNFDVDAEIKELKYATYRPTNISAVGNVKPNRLIMSRAGATLGKSTFNASGIINNLFDYTLADGVLAGNMKVTSGFIDLADFMTEEATEAVAAGTTTEAEMTAAVPIPDNINLNVDLAASGVKYDNIDLKNMAGQLVIQNRQAVIQNGKADLLGGSMTFDGAYDTSEPGDPGFRFHYDLAALDFGQTFATLNTFAALAPIGKYLQGKLNTNMVIDGKLGPDLFPKLNSINADGLLKTASARLSGFAPLNKIGQALNIDRFKENATFKNLVAIFHIKDGQVRVEPFDLRVAGIPMLVQGTHGLDRDMDYSIRAAIPRDLIEGNIVTGTALSALDQLAGQAGKLGLNISPGDTLNVMINLLGNIGNPQVKFNLLGGKDGENTSVEDAMVGAVTDRINQEIDTRKEEVKTEVTNRVNDAKGIAQARADSLRSVATQRAQQVRDSIANRASSEADKLKAKAAQELRNRLKIDSLRADSLLRLVPGADRIKEELDKFNPFKKKKPGGGGA